MTFDELIESFNAISFVDRFGHELVDRYKLNAMYGWYYKYLYDKYLAKLGKRSIRILDVGARYAAGSLNLAYEGKNDGRNVTVLALDISAVSLHLARAVILNRDFYENSIRKRMIDGNKILESIMSFYDELFSHAPDDYWRFMNSWYGIKDDDIAKIKRGAKRLIASQKMRGTDEGGRDLFGELTVTQMHRMRDLKEVVGKV